MSDMELSEDPLDEFVLDTGLDGILEMDEESMHEGSADVALNAYGTDDPVPQIPEPCASVDASEDSEEQSGDELNLDEDGVVFGQKDRERAARENARDLADPDADKNGNLAGFMCEEEESSFISDLSSVEEGGNGRRKLNRKMQEEENAIADMLASGGITKALSRPPPPEELTTMPGGKKKDGRPEISPLEMEKIKEGIVVPETNMRVWFENDKLMVAEQEQESVDGEEVQIPTGMGLPLANTKTDPVPFYQLVFRISAAFFELKDVILSKMMTSPEQESCHTIAFMLFYLLSADFEATAEKHRLEYSKNEREKKISSYKTRIHAVKRKLHALKQQEADYVERKMSQGQDVYVALLAARKRFDNDVTLMNDKISELNSSSSSSSGAMRGRFAFKDRDDIRIEFDRAQMSIEQIVSATGSTVGGSIFANVFDPKMDINRLLVTLFNVNASRDTASNQDALVGTKRRFVQRNKGMSETELDRAMNAIRAIGSSSDYAHLIRKAYSWNSTIVKACDEMLDGLRGANSERFSVTSEYNLLRPSHFFSPVVQFGIWSDPTDQQSAARMRMFLRSGDERIAARDMASAESFGIEHPRHPRIPSMCLQQASLDSYTSPFSEVVDGPRSENDVLLNEVIGDLMDEGSEGDMSVDGADDVERMRTFPDVNVASSVKCRADGNPPPLIADVVARIKEIRREDKQFWPPSFSRSVALGNVNPTLTRYPCDALVERIDLTSTSARTFLNMRFARHDLGSQAFIAAMEDPYTSLYDAYRAIKEQHKRMIEEMEEQFRDDDGVVDHARLNAFLNQAGLVGEDTDGNELVAKMLKEAPAGGLIDVKEVLLRVFDRKMVACRMQYKNDLYSRTHKQAIKLIQRQSIQTMTEWAMDPNLMGDKSWLMSTGFRNSIKYVMERDGMQTKLNVPMVPDLTLGGSIIIADMCAAKVAFSLDSGTTLRLFVTEQLVYLAASDQLKSDVLGCIVCGGAGMGKSYAARAALSTLVDGCYMILMRTTTTSMFSESKTYSGIARYFDELDTSYTADSDHPEAEARQQMMKDLMTSKKVSVETPGGKDAETGKRTTKHIIVCVDTSMLYNSNSSMSMHTSLNGGELKPLMSRFLFLMRNPFDRSMGTHVLKELMRAMDYLRENGTKHDDPAMEKSLERMERYKGDIQYIHSLAYYYHLMSYEGLFRACDMGIAQEVLETLGERVNQYQCANGYAARSSSAATYGMYMSSDTADEMAVGSSDANAGANDRFDKPPLTLIRQCVMRRALMTVVCTPAPSGLADELCAKDGRPNPLMMGVDGILNIMSMAQKYMFVTDDDIAWVLSLISESYIPIMTCDIMYAMRELVLNKEVSVQTPRNPGDHERTKIVMRSTDVLVRKLNKIKCPIDATLIGMMLEKITAFRYDGFPVLHIQPGAKARGGRKDTSDLNHGSYHFDVEAVLSGAFELGGAIIPAVIQEKCVGGRGRPESVPVMFHPFLRTSVKDISKSVGDDLDDNDGFVSVQDDMNDDDPHIMIKVETLLPSPCRYVEIAMERTLRLGLLLRKNPDRLRDAIDMMHSMFKMETPLTDIEYALTQFDDKSIIVYTEPATTSHSVLRRQAEVGVTIDNDEYIVRTNDLLDSDIRDSHVPITYEAMKRIFEGQKDKRLTYRVEPSDEITMSRHHNAIHEDSGLMLTPAHITYGLQSKYVRGFIRSGLVDYRLVCAMVGYINQCNNERDAMREEVTDVLTRESDAIVPIKGSVDSEVAQPPFDGSFNMYASRKMQEAYNYKHDAEDDPLYKTVCPDRYERIFVPLLRDIFTFVGSHYTDQSVQDAFGSGRDFLNVFILDAEGNSRNLYEDDTIIQRRAARRRCIPIADVPGSQFMQEGIYFVWDTPDVQSILDDLSLLIDMETLVIRSHTLIDLYFEDDDINTMSIVGNPSAVHQYESDPTVVLMHTVHDMWFIEVPYDQTRMEHERRLTRSSHHRMLHSAASRAPGRLEKEIGCHMLNIEKENDGGRDVGHRSMLNAPRTASIPLVQMVMDNRERELAAIQCDIQETGVDYASQHQQNMMVESVMMLPGVKKRKTGGGSVHAPHLQAVMDIDEGAGRRLRKESMTGTAMREVAFGHSLRETSGGGDASSGTFLLQMVQDRNGDDLYHLAAKRLREGE